MAARVIPYLAALAMAVAVVHPALAQYGVRPYQPAPVYRPNPYYAPQPYVPVQPYPVPGTAPLSSYVPRPVAPPPPPVVVVPFGAYGSTVR